MAETNFYMPEWHGVAADVVNQFGHGGGDYFVMRRFFEAIRTQSQPDFDVYFATTTASVAILSHRSMLAGGEPFDIPDFHKEEDRIKYENDTLTPFFGSDGSEPTMPCCSRPDYRPSEEQLSKYRELVSPAKE